MSVSTTVCKWKMIELVRREGLQGRCSVTEAGETGETCGRGFRLVCPASGTGECGPGMEPACPLENLLATAPLTTAEDRQSSDKTENCQCVPDFLLSIYRLILGSLQQQDQQQSGRNLLSPGLISRVFSGQARPSEMEHACVCVPKGSLDSEIVVPPPIDSGMCTYHIKLRTMSV